MDFNKLPKLLVDSWHLNHNRAWFFFGFTSGEETSAFLLPPAGAKMLLKHLQERIGAYEKDFGTISMEGVQAGIQSPFQQKK
jgi:hypothetical protein